jgi:hypothetical protein
MPVIEPLIGPTDPVLPGPCDWPIDVSCCPEWSTFSATVQGNATVWATQVLDALTGRRFEQCAVNYRPCGPKCAQSFGYLTWPVGASANGGGMPWMIPWVDAGVWRNCGCTGGCTCRAACEVPFPGPVSSISEVLIDGVALDPAAYRLDSHKGVPVLVRTDGVCWPECQDMALDINEVGSFTIVYRPGTGLPTAGRIAAGLLACEFAKACAGQDCALPQQLASLSRNGVEVQMVDPASLLADGLTGIANVDLWVRSVNPQRKAQRSRVYSSDLVGPRYSA